MGWFTVLIGVIAAWLLYDTGHPVLFTLSVIAAVGEFWSWGIMHNYATEHAKRRESYRGGFNDLTESDLNAVPSGITWVNMAFGWCCVVLLYVGILVRAM